MRNIILALAGAAGLVAAASAAAQASDRFGDIGWGSYYNNHLSQWDGRPLGPPLSALPPGYQYYNGVPRPVYDGYPPYDGPGVIYVRPRRR